MSTVLVTGANGFLGRHVCRRAAAQGHQVVGIGHGSWARDDPRSSGLGEWHELDVTLASLEARGGRPDLLVHCAGGSSVGASIESPAEDFERTAATTIGVLEYLRTRSPNTALVYPSSTAVYGCAAQMPIDEDCQPSPISPYGVHKLIAEDLCRSYGRTFGLRMAIVRVFSAYGVGLRKQLLWDASRRASAGDFRFGGTGRETRDWVHAEDVADLLLLAADHASPGVPTVNGATGIETANHAILELLFEALGTGRTPEFTGIARAGDPERYVGDPSRAASWGWSPRRRVDEGVREYAGWFRALTG